MVDHQGANGDGRQPSSVWIPVYHVVRTETPDFLRLATPDVLMCLIYYGDAIPPLNNSPKAYIVRVPRQ